jgi:hypothetical protein
VSEVAAGPGGQPEPPPIPSLVAELWYREAPDLADPRVLEALREIAPGAERQSGSLSVPRPDLAAEVDGRPIPLFTVVVAASPLGSPGKQLPDVSQTWDWPGAEVAVSGCASSVLVTEMFAATAPPVQRVTALTEVVRVLVEQTSPAVISWPQTQRVSDPAALRTSTVDDVVNLRFFSVGDGGTEMIMDTLGLHLFGLPDVQCHYRDANPAEIAALLVGTAGYIFDAGDVIADGNTISGAAGDERYVCRHEMSLVGPAREVIDVDLGDPYAAGSRQRDSG